MAVMKLSAINADIVAHQLGWLAEENSITLLTEAEQNARLGYVPDPASGEMSLALREQHASSVAQAMALRAPDVAAPSAPALVDLRAYNGHNYITAVRDQGGCGSCVAFGTIAAIEGTSRFVGRNASLAIDLSEGHLFNCIARSQGRNCGNGWWVNPALTAVRDQGVVDEACSPYSAADQTCVLCSGWQSRVIKIRGFQQLNSVSAMKNQLAATGPLVTCFSVYSDFFAYRSNVYRRSPSSTLRGGHCVCVVGFDDSLGAWICKNSWGSGWGDGGFFKIAYGQCGIDASMWAVEVGAVPPAAGLAPLHRYWNASIGDHFYTTNWGELGSGRYGWTYEGVQCDIAPVARSGLVPLYRYWNSSAGDHFYTTNWGELGSGRYGWAYEGIQGYVSPTPQPGLIAVYRYWNSKNADHFYTTNWSELGGGNYGYSYEGIQCYVWPNSATVSDGDVPEAIRSQAFNAPGLAGPISASFVMDEGVGAPTPLSFTMAGLNPVPSSFAMAAADDAKAPASFSTDKAKCDCPCLTK